jgi:hypothetical protein
MSAPTSEDDRVPPVGRPAGPPAMPPRPTPTRTEHLKPGHTGAGHAGAERVGAGVSRPEPDPASAETSPVHDPEPAPVASTRPPAEDREAERGLRGLVGSGASQVGPRAAMRARDAARPTDDELAAAERDLVIIRRHWVPREELPRSR